MKVLIDIPEYVYERIREYYEKNDTVESTYSYIYHGTPIPDNATNGDIVQMMFPKLEYKYTVIDEYTNKPTYVQIIDGDMILTNFSTAWWNAPYQKGGKE